MASSSGSYAERRDRRRADRKRDERQKSPQTSAIDKTLPDLFKALESTDINSTQPPAVKTIEWFHRNASKDRDADLHHQIGNGPGDVARGNHNHDGKNSPPLFATADIPASPAATTGALKTAVDALILLLAGKAG